jgi:hypothetical protein
MPSMFGKAKPADQPFSLENELDRVLSAAQKNGISARSIAELLERRAESMRPATRSPSISAARRRRCMTHTAGRSRDNQGPKSPVPASPMRSGTIPRYPTS